LASLPEKQLNIWQSTSDPRHVLFCLRSVQEKQLIFWHAHLGKHIERGGCSFSSGAI
jgi:hypothetical protein